MAKSKSLPWKSAPKAFIKVLVGSEEYGSLELPKKGCLTINEAQFIRENTKDFPDVQQKAVELAYEISTKEGISKVEAFEALTGEGSVAQEYVLELMEFQKQTVQFKPIIDSVYATSMLRRIQGPEWSLEETAGLPIPFVADLAEFCLKEMNGWIEESEGEVDPPALTEEDLKND